MGNVCGGEAPPVNESDVQLSDGKKPAMPAPGLHRSMSNVQVTELIDALVSTALPLVRKMVSKKLIHQGLIVKNEEPVENFNPLDMPFEPFTGLGSRLPATPPCPLAPALTTAASALSSLQRVAAALWPCHPPPAHAPPPTPHPTSTEDANGKIGLGSMQILTPAEMKAEMEKYPDFAWPKDCVKEMMEDKELLVLEMKGLSVGVFFSKGYEIKVPLPLGCAVEIGHDGKMEKAGLEVHLPKVWAWFNARTMVMKVALMACPDIRPALHVNLEAFKMDFSVPGLSKEGINEGGWLDDIVEYVAVGFGPCTTQKEMPGWFSEKIGDLIRGQLKSMAGLGCGRPYELNMRGGGTDDAPRPSKEIREEMAVLQAELYKAEKHEKEKKEQDKGCVVS